MLCAPCCAANYLKGVDGTYDVSVIMEGLERFQDVISASPHLEIIQPAPDADLAYYVRRFAGTYNHHVGTCRMGDASDAQSVVDRQLRVVGAHALRVADASVIPEIPNANTAAIAMMVGFHGADIIMATPPVTACATR
eukprot:3491950-Pleurochrysis_carterae.AAC.2